MDNVTEKGNDGLDLSVLIATRDRAQLLEATLGHLRRQRLDGVNWEVVVIDNGSTDETASLLERAAGHLPLVVLNEPEAGKNRALNRALDAARGRLLVFTDDDMELAPGWLAGYCDAAARWPDYSIFCGPITPIYPEATPAWLREHPYAGPAYAKFAPSQAEGPLNSATLPFGGNYAVRARAMSGIRFCLKLGPKGKSFPLGDETELLRRLCAQGERVVYLPGANTGHCIQPHQITLDWLFKRAFNIGRGMARLNPERNAHGAPGGAWKARYQLSLNWARQALHAFSGERRRFETGAQFQFLRGRLFEQRLMAAEAKETRQGANL
jgi:glycosyltransferase involved in cell wall biosynthesis